MFLDVTGEVINDTPASKLNDIPAKVSSTPDCFGFTLFFVNKCEGDSSVLSLCSFLGHLLN